jgi:hypothetical protein
MGPFNTGKGMDENFHPASLSQKEPKGVLAFIHHSESCPK